MWCAPSFRLESPSPVRAERLDFDAGAGLDSAFVLSNVLSRGEAERMVATADEMGFQRDPGDEGERRNGAVSWVLHDGLILDLLLRISPHVPLAIYQQRPGRAAPSPSELAVLAEALPLWARGCTPWVRESAGAPEGFYHLSGLSARSRVYRYDADTDDAFLPHHDEVWPGSSLACPDGDGEDGMPKLTYDGWKYNSAEQGEWAWSEGDRVSHLSVLLYLNDDFDGGQTLLHPQQQEEEEEEGGGGGGGGGGQTLLHPQARGGEARSEGVQGRPVAFTPVSGTALCFAQSFSFGRRGVPHGADALLHEGLPVRSPPGRPHFARPAAKYIMRTDIVYTMPHPPDAGPPAAESTLNDPQAAQQMTVELSSDPETRAQQLELLRSYGYDTSSF